MHSLIANKATIMGKRDTQAHATRKDIIVTSRFVAVHTANSLFTLASVDKTSARKLLACMGQCHPLTQ